MKREMKKTVLKKPASAGKTVKATKKKVKK